VETASLADTFRVATTLSKARLSLMMMQLIAVITRCRMQQRLTSNAALSCSAASMSNCVPSQLIAMRHDGLNFHKRFMSEAQRGLSVSNHNHDDYENTVQQGLACLPVLACVQHWPLVDTYRMQHI
jgi:hypothetical protein